MKYAFKLVFASVLFGLTAICLPVICQAQLATKINIIQNTDTILIQAEITEIADQSLSLKLSKQAEIISASGLVVSANGDAGYLLKPNNGNTAQIKYALKLDQSQIQYLLEEQNWYPRVDDINLPQIFSIQTTTAVGTEVIHSATTKVQSGVSLVIGKFVKYLSPSKKIAIYLQKEDPSLAETLMTNLDSYLINYEKDLGTYPYDQFSVVESSDEIGYAFPRMTWIGSQLLRFPFILKTSLPHELLHSWWGNSVFVDYKTGNWCEGLTVFGADYALLNETEKTTYRQKALLEYVDYVKQADEISLSEFVSRGEDKSLQAIGYNKSLMVFVMLEQLVGADVFKKSLTEFSQDYKYKTASYQDLFQIIQAQSSVKESVLHNFYSTWILGKGAITFETLKGISDQKSVTFTLNQAELNKLQDLNVDFLIYFSDGSTEVVTTKLSEKTVLQLTKKAIQFTVDPQFKLFRKLSNQERPISFSNFFASSEAQIQTTSETLDIVKQVFSKISFQPSRLTDQNLSTPGTVLVEDYQGGFDLIDQILNKKNVSIHADSIIIDGQNISLSENGYFISLKVKEKIVILFKTNISLPIKRWFERWSHYGAQGYVVLSPKAAIKQGIWDNPLIQDLK